MRRSRLVIAVAALFGVGLLVCGCKEGDPLSGGIAPVKAGFLEEQRPQEVTSDYVVLHLDSVNAGRVLLEVVAAVEAMTESL